MKRKKKDLQKLMYGTPQVARPQRVESPSAALAQNGIDMARAMAARENWLTNGLDVLGNLGLSAGKTAVGQYLKANPDASGWAKAIPTGLDALGMLGNGASQGLFAYGGFVPQGAGVPVELEGGELGETPHGQTFGVEAVLPEATRVYSNRVRVDGVTMADRKGKRKKREVTLEKLLERNGMDTLLRNSMERTRQANAKEEEMDLAVQGLVGDLLAPPAPSPRDAPMRMDREDPLGMPNGATGPTLGYLDWLKPLDTGGDAGPLGLAPQMPEERDLTGKEYAYGGIVPDHGTPVVGILPDTSPYTWDFADIPANVPPRTWDLSDLRPDTSPYTWDFGSVPTAPASGTKLYRTDGTPWNAVPHQPAPNLIDPATIKTPWQQMLDSIGAGAKNFGIGDALALGGGLYSALSPMKQTLANRAGDTPNINPYRDYGKQGLKKLDSTKGHLRSMRDNGLREAEEARGQASRRARASARGANTARAMDAAVYAQAEAQKNRLRDAHDARMLQLMGQEAALLDRRDQMYMQGEAQRDMADRHDRDAFYTQMARDMAAKGRGVQEIGRMVNQMRRRDAMMELMNQWSRYGIRVGADAKLHHEGE